MDMMYDIIANNHGIHYQEALKSSDHLAVSDEDRETYTGGMQVASSGKEGAGSAI